MLLQKSLRLVLFCFLFSLALPVSAQTDAAQTASNEEPPTASPTANSSSNATQTKSESEEVLRLLRAQQAELERMRALLTEQTKTINELQRRVEQTEVRMTTEVVRTTNVAASDTLAEAMRVPTTAPAPEGKKQEDEDAAKADAERRKRNETLSKQFGSMTISGDLRFRYESFYGLLIATPNDDNPAILGNPLTTRQRFRLRARLQLRGQFGKDFDWGLRLATGSFADAISTNQTLTDFYNRKPFGLDQAYIAWSPERVPGLRLQAGKFDVPWVRTEMTIDNDLQPEGFNQIYSRGFKNSVFKNLTFVAWQLPFLERNSAFVRNPNGTISLNDSERGGRDLALYGAQVRGRFEFSKQVALTLSVADLYFSGTQFISPVQVFGNLLLLPVTFTIPATATTPAQTITTQVAIPRDLLVAGNGNLGLSTATNNAVNRDGRLASGYNLVDVIARLDLKHSKQWPITLIMNFVTNTQTHDVVVAGPGGANQFLKNNENNGYYAELLAGKQEKRGDWLFIYTFTRVEKDAVLTPFNFSDVFQQSDVRAQRVTINYMVDPRVALTLTGIVTERSNGLLGVFGSTPPGSLNRPTTRLQFDTSFRF